MGGVPSLRPVLVTLSLAAAGAGVDAVAAQGPSSEGTAVVTVGADEYTVVIECDDPSGPEAGFGTQPNRLTRQTRGRANGVNVRLRPWEATDEVVVSVDRLVAWVPRPASGGGALELEIEMSPHSAVWDGTPVLMTYERWRAGERFDGKRTVKIRAQCGVRDPAAPSHRKLAPPGGG